MIIKILALAVELFCRRFANIINTKRAEMAIGELTVAIGKTIYSVTCSFKNGSKVSVSDKLLRLMENELEKDNNTCYNILNTKSQESLDCKPERSIV